MDDFHEGANVCYTAARVGTRGADEIITEGLFVILPIAHEKRRRFSSSPSLVMQLRGLEPLPKYMDMNLNHARMPIPPQLHMQFSFPNSYAIR